MYLDCDSGQEEWYDANDRDCDLNLNNQYSEDGWLNFDEDFQEYNCNNESEYFPTQNTINSEEEQRDLPSLEIVGKERRGFDNKNKKFLEQWDDWTTVEPEEVLIVYFILF